jgi:hypothetical protein
MQAPAGAQEAFFLQVGVARLQVNLHLLASLQTELIQAKTTKNPRVLLVTRPARGSTSKKRWCDRRPLGQPTQEELHSRLFFGAKISRAQANTGEVELAPRDPWNHFYTPV